MRIILQFIFTLKINDQQHVQYTHPFLHFILFRKSLITDNRLDAQRELLFTELILSKHPKSSETFNQR